MGTRNGASKIVRLPKTNDIAVDLDAMYFAMTIQLQWLRYATRTTYGVDRLTAETKNVLRKSITVNDGIGRRGVQRSYR